MNARRLFLSVAATVAALVGAAGSARADIQIDDFSNPDPSKLYFISFATANPFHSSDALANGLTRDVTVTVTAPTPSLPTSANGTLGGGQFSMFTDSLSTANSVISYSGFGSAGLGDFSGGGSVGLNFTSLDSGGNISNTPIAIDIQTASGTLSYKGTVDNAGQFSASLGSFTGSGDLTQVTGLKFTINGDPSLKGADFSVNSVTTPTKAVPAPPAAILGLVAFPLLGLWRRKKAA